MVRSESSVSQMPANRLDLARMCFGRLASGRVLLQSLCSVFGRSSGLMWLLNVSNFWYNNYQLSISYSLSLECMQTGVCNRVCVYMYIYIYICIFVFIFMLTYVCVSVCIYVCMYASM